MEESSIYTDCELEYIGEGYSPSWAAEICANEESRRSVQEKEKSSNEKRGSIKEK